MELITNIIVLLGALLTLIAFVLTVKIARKQRGQKSRSDLLKEFKGGDRLKAKEYIKSKINEDREAI